MQRGSFKLIAAHAAFGSTLLDPRGDSRSVAARELRFFLSKAAGETAAAVKPSRRTMLEARAAFSGVRAVFAPIGVERNGACESRPRCAA